MNDRKNPPDIAKSFARDAFGSHYVDERILCEMAGHSPRQVYECRGAIQRLTDAKANYSHMWKSRGVQA